MSNPYLDDTPQGDTTPQPTPKPISLFVGAWEVALLALLVAIAGLFLPGGIDFDRLPIPVPPFDNVAPVVDPADTEGSWVVVVEQTEQRTLEQAKLLRDTQYWQSLETRGLNWRHYDYDSADAKAYRAQADAVGMPAVVIVLGKGDVGKVLAKFPLPAKDELDAKIKEATAR
jgi:hypothetical protein